MYQLRILIVIASVWLFFLFGLASSGAVGLDLSPAIYILIPPTVLLIFFFPDLGRWHWGTLALAVILGYLVINALLFREQGHLTWASVAVELTVLLVTVFLARATSVLVAKLEHVVESIVVDANKTRVLPIAEGEEVMNDELFRARRFDRPVTFMLLVLSDTAELRRIRSDRFYVQAALQRAYFRARVSQLAESLLYRTDPIAWYGDDLVVCLPETSREEAEKLAYELYDLIRITLNIRLPIGLSSFPADGLIYRDLVDAAARRLFRAEDLPAAGLVEPSVARPSASAHIEQTSKQTIATKSAAYEVPNDFERMPLTGEGALALRQDGSSSFLFSLGPSLLSTWDELTRPFTLDARRRLPEDAPPYYDPGFWINRLPYQSADTRQLYRKIKRAMDLGAVFASLPLTLPLGALIAGLIWLEDRASPLYAQRRIGLGGKPFKMYKFRSMIPNADKRLEELGVRVNERGETINEQGEKLEDDPRITRLGKILRKTSLDEFPQLWNVLKGDMSLVGPRPTSFGVDKYSLLQTQRLSVKPGITGLWQIYDRGDTDFDNRLIWDIKYIEKMSLSLDLELLIRTVMKFRQGAR